MIEFGAVESATMVFVRGLRGLSVFALPFLFRRAPRSVLGPDGIYILLRDTVGLEVLANVSLQFS
jgi:hypothetical protein